MALTEDQVRTVIMALNAANAFRMPNGESISVFDSKSLAEFYGKSPEHAAKVMEVIGKIDKEELKIANIEAYRDEVLLPGVPADAQLKRTEALLVEGGKVQKAELLVRQESAKEARLVAQGSRSAAQAELSAIKAKKKELEAEVWKQRYQIFDNTLTIMDTMAKEVLRQFGKGVTNAIATTASELQVGIKKFRDDTQKLFTRGFEDVSEATSKAFGDLVRKASKSFKVFSDYMHDTKESFLDATTNRKLYRQVAMLTDGFAKSLEGHTEEAKIAVRADEIAHAEMIKARTDDLLERKKDKKDAQIEAGSSKVKKSLARRAKDTSDLASYAAEKKRVFDEVQGTLRKLGATPGGDSKAARAIENGGRGRAPSV